MDITWLGHGTFLFLLPSGEHILMDPWTEGNPRYPADFTIPKIDLMLITHGHFDHIHDAVPLAKKHSPQVGAIYETCHWLESKGVKNVNPMNKGGTQQIGSVSITMTHAIHSCGILDDGKIIYGGEAAGYVMRFPDNRCLYFAGDTNVFTDMQLIEQLYHPELVFLPIGDLYTMSPVEAAVAVRLLKPKKVICMHFGTFPPLIGHPDQLRELTKDTGAEILMLEPGKAYTWTA